jgi:ABC-type transport system substrate-binding protein
MLLGLADLNDQSEFVPELASSWEHSKDYLELTYNLRKDAVWSDGVPITAEDVKFTYDLMMDSTVASPRQGATEYIRRLKSKIRIRSRFILPKHIPIKFSTPLEKFYPSTCSEMPTTARFEVINSAAIPFHRGRSFLKNG